MYNNAHRRYVSRLILAAAALLSFAAAPAAASEYRYSWDFGTVANALRGADFGFRFDGVNFLQNCQQLTDCAVVSLYLAPSLPAGTVNVLGAFGPATWTNRIDLPTQGTFFDPVSSPLPVRLITDNTNLHGTIVYSTNTWTATAPVPAGGGFGVLVSTTDPAASLPANLTWTLDAIVIGLNADGTQRSFDTAKDPNTEVTLATESFQQVPEPGSLALAGTALAAILCAARKRHRQA